MKIKVLILVILLCNSIPSKFKADTIEVDFTFTLHLIDDSKGKDLLNSPVHIYEDGKLKKKIISGEEGLAKFFCKPDKEYKIVLVGHEEFVEKYLLIDTRNIDFHNWKYNNTEQVSLRYDIDVKVFKTKGSCQDFDFLKEEPCMLMKYDTEYNDFHDFAPEPLRNKIKEELKKKC